MSGLKTLFLLCFIAALSVASCPNDCGEFGSCGFGVCHCFENHVGDDCSIYNEFIKVGHDYRQDVKNQEWKYFTLSTTFIETITWTLQIDPPIGFTPADCDLYINKGVYPSPIHRLAFNTSDGYELTSTLVRAEPGTYIAGVVGKDQCSFRIRADYSSICGNNCHGHGTCNSLGICQCFERFIGEECEVDVVTPGLSIHASSANLSWRNFAFIPDKAYRKIVWTVSPVPSGFGNCILYTSTDHKPTLSSYDSANIPLAPAKLTQNDVDVGHTYYLGVNGFALGCNFSVTLHTFVPGSKCPNNCSDHSSGTCLDSECTCLTGYSGFECEEYDEDMENHVAYFGWIGDEAWNYYHYKIQSNGSVMVTLNRLSSFGDVNLFVRFGEKPNIITCDYSNMRMSTKLSIEIVDARPGEVFYIGIFTWDAAKYSVIVDETGFCPCIDENHGKCLDDVSGICHCEAYFAGADCSIPVTQLKSGEALKEQSVLFNEWNYYQIPAEDVSAALVTVVEEGFGDVWVFVSFNKYPTADDYLFSDKNYGSDVHQIAHRSNEAFNGIIFIGVYGSPHNPRKSDKAGYSIECYVSKF